MNISNMDKAKILAALYNNSKPQGIKYQHFDKLPMTKEEAQLLLNSGQTYFDYLNGRIIKIDLSGNELETQLYNHNNGKNAAETILKNL